MVATQRPSFSLPFAFLLAVLAILFYNGVVWLTPGVTSDYYPTQDCGPNWMFALRHEGKDICIGMIAAQKVKEMVDEAQKSDPHLSFEDGYVYLQSHLDEILHFIAKMWGH